MKAFIVRGLVVLAGAVLVVIGVFIGLQYLIANPLDHTRSNEQLPTAVQKSENI